MKQTTVDPELIRVYNQAVNVLRKAESARKNELNFRLQPYRNAMQEITAEVTARYADAIKESEQAARTLRTKIFSDWFDGYRGRYKNTVL